MTDKTFTFTIEQIKEIYQAGIRRGNDEQCAHDWGTSTYGSEYGECVMALHDIVNADKRWSDSGYTGYDVIEKWFKEK